MRFSSAIRTTLVGAAVVAALAASTSQLTAATLVGAGPGPANLAAPIVNQPATIESPLREADHPALFARAAATRNAFGFPVGSSRVGLHVQDDIQGAAYDEVTEVNSSGQPMAMTQFNSDGSLLDAVRFDSPALTLLVLSSDSATRTALRALTASGMAPSGQVRTEADQSAGGWDLHWDRAQAGFTVRGDETRVHVWRDGRIQSVARVEHKLAAAPIHPIGRAGALLAIVRQLTAWFGAASSGYAIQTMDLEWVGSNAAFDATRIVAAAQPYKLAWVANVRPSGAASESLQLITLYVDAGNGTVIGGDVAE